MSGFEEETYSTIFTSLKHPVRRKILRMLSEKPKNFSEILDALGISSSHLTYHLEKLGELVSKTENGKYRLSTFGEAAVGTMRKVEEMPKATKPKRLPSLPIKWKSFFVVLMVGLVVTVVVIASIAVHYRHLERIREFEQLLKSEHYPIYHVRMNVSSFKLIFDVSKERFIELAKEKTGSNVPEDWDRPIIVGVPIIFKDDSHFYLYEKYEPPFSVAYCYTVPWI